MPLAGGAVVVYNASGLQYYRPGHWLVSSRLAPTPSRGIYYDGAYAPYGEDYAENGTTGRSFPGDDQVMVSSGSYPLYDFPMREYHPTWGRWISPDPAGLAAANPANPQTRNRYAYVGNNPLSSTDPVGLFTCGPALCPPNVAPSNPCEMEGGGPACDLPPSCAGEYTCGPGTPSNTGSGTGPGPQTQKQKDSPQGLKEANKNQKNVDAVLQNLYDPIQNAAESTGADPTCLAAIACGTTFDKGGREVGSAPSPVGASCSR